MCVISYLMYVSFYCNTIYIYICLVLFCMILLMIGFIGHFLECAQNEADFYIIYRCIYELGYNFINISYNIIIGIISWLVNLMMDILYIYI